MCTLLAAVLIACSSVAFTGRNRVLLYSDSEITSLSNESYNELMSTTKVSDNKAQAAMIQEVGERLTGALTKYLASKGEQSLLDDITWSFKLVQDDQVNAFCMPGGQVVFYEGIMPLCDTPDLVAVVMGHLLPASWALLQVRSWSRKHPRTEGYCSRPPLQWAANTVICFPIHANMNRKPMRLAFI